MADDFSEFDTSGDEFAEFDSQPQPREYGLESIPDIATDVGPSSAGVQEESLRPRQRGIVERSSRGLLQDLPLKETLGGAVEASYEKLIKNNPADFLDLYRKSRDENRQFWDDERTQNGTAGKVAGVVGNLAPGVASMALPGGPVMQGAISGGLTALDQSRADLTKGELGKAAVDTGIGAGVGAAASWAFPQIISAVTKPIQKAGAALQIPQKIKDSAANIFGGTKAARWLAGSGDDAADDALKSARTKDLEATLSDATKSVQDSVPLPKDDLATRLARAANRGTAELDEAGGFSFDPSEFGDDFANMQADVIEEMAKKHYPEINPSDAGRGISMLDAIKVASKKSAQAPVKATPRVDTPTRVDRLVSDQADQFSPAAAESIRNRAFNSDLSSGIQDEERALIQKAIQLRETVKQNDAMAAEKFVTDTAEANRLKSVADSARSELDRLTTGNKALGKLFGGLAGAKAGGAIGGIPGAVMGATAGAAGGSKMLQGADLAGAAGQRLANVSSIADQLATRNDAVGRMARFALSGDNQSRAVNMAILAEMPEVQELIGNGGTDR